MVTKRLIHESGHKRKFLAIVDYTPECKSAVHYAARRAFSTDGVLVLLYVCQPEEFQHWLGVGEIMRAEALEEAETHLHRFSGFVRKIVNMDPELVIREGKSSDEVIQLIEDDPDIAVLVLAAGESNDGPGPLVSMVAGRSSSFPIPVIVVPASMSEEEIEAVA